VKPETAMFASN